MRSPGSGGGSVSSVVRSKDAMNDSFCQEFWPGIENGVSWDINRESNATASNQVSNEMSFQKRDMGTEINRDGGPGIGERKLGEGDVMVLINREGRMV